MTLPTPLFTESGNLDKGIPKEMPATIDTIRNDKNASTLKYDISTISNTIHRSTIINDIIDLGIRFG